MSMASRINILVISILFLSSCTAEKRQYQVIPAFYHWQTELNLSEAERLLIDRLDVKKIYAKFFDIDWDEGRQNAIPHATIKINPMRLSGLQIIPTIFITNRTLKNSSPDQLELLANKLIHKIQKLAQKNNLEEISEIQIDCDWTLQTKEKYFALIRAIKKQFTKDTPVLSATIRLHQIRYFQRTGVPPVDYGVLMFYNMGDLEDWEETNSILNLEKAEPYLEGAKKYPLPLDVALPIFSWGVLFRNGEMIKLINNLRSFDLKDTTRFLKIGPERFKVIKSTYIKGYYLYTGDLIRTEYIEPHNLVQASMLMQQSMDNAERTILFYHLDTSTIKYFTYEKLEAACRALQQ